MRSYGDRYGFSAWLPDLRVWDKVDIARHFRVTGKGACFVPHGITAR